MRKIWEYKIEVYHADERQQLVEFLNKLGENGWELTSANNVESFGSPFYFILKRPKNYRVCPRR